MMRRWLPLLILLHANGAWSASVHVTPPAGCAGKTKLSTQGARLSEVLGQLALALNFELEFKSQNDPAINLSGEWPAKDLIQALTHSHNLVLVDEADPRCAGQSRIVKVALLPKGPETPLRSLPPPARPMTPEEMRGLEIYRKAHGLDENGNPKAPVRR